MKNRNFKGIWIPKEVYCNTELTWSEKILLVEIDSLDNEEGCFASNPYFSEFIGISATSVSACISKLVKLGYVENLGFDGRVRTLKSLMKFKKPPYDLVKSRLTKNRKGVNDKSKGSITKNHKHNNTINNTSNKTTKDKSFLYQEMVAVYDKFIKSKLGVGAKIDGQQGKAIKSIISYLKTNVKGSTEKDIVNAWQFIFEKWDMLDDFTQKQIKLSQINSNILNILNQIRNGKKAGNTNLESEIRNRVRNRKRN